MISSISFISPLSDHINTIPLEINFFDKSNDFYIKINIY